MADLAGAPSPPLLVPEDSYREPATRGSDRRATFILRYFRYTGYPIESNAGSKCLQRRTSADTRACASFEGSGAMSAVQFDSEISWDGNSLTVWANVNGSRVLCEIPRSTIHRVPFLSDEISRDRAAIFYRLRPAVVAKIARSRDNFIRLHSSDVSAPVLWRH